MKQRLLQEGAIDQAALELDRRLAMIVVLERLPMDAIDRLIRQAEALREAQPGHT